MIRAGELRDRVSVLQWSPEQSPEWGDQPGYRDIGISFWAKVEPLSATEKATGNGVQEVISHVVTTRYRCDLSPKDRLLWRGRTLEVVSILESATRSELRIECREYPAEGEGTTNG
ncbi:MAG: phage head closure protein [Bacillota bacterium]